MEMDIYMLVREIRLHGILCYNKNITNLLEGWKWYNIIYNPDMDKQYGIHKGKCKDGRIRL